MRWTVLFVINGKYSTNDRWYIRCISAARSLTCDNGQSILIHQFLFRLSTYLLTGNKSFNKRCENFEIENWLFFYVFAPFLILWFSVLSYTWKNTFKWHNSSLLSMLPKPSPFYLVFTKWRFLSIRIKIYKKIHRHRRCHWCFASSKSIHRLMEYFFNIGLRCLGVCVNDSCTENLNDT